MEQVTKLFKSALLGAVVFGFAACDDEREYEPSTPIENRQSTLARNGGGDGRASYESGESGTERRSLPGSSCHQEDRLEFDIYDADPEFTNPKNYQLILKKDGRLLRKQAFSQYCTLNNTVSFSGLPTGKYEYTVTSSCSRRIIQGQIDYLGGYQGHVMYIDQSLCD